MNALKAGRPVIDAVKLCYAANTPALLVGPHGVGKSALLERSARELKIGYICRDLSLMEPPDLVGIPRLDDRVTRFSPPSFLPTGGKGLLVFEELNRCAAYMRAPTLQLLTARTLNDYALPPGWLPVAAINPPQEGYEADELDPAQRSRLVELSVEADRDEWLAWAREGGIHPAVIAYVEADKSIFDDPQSNPRAWENVSRLVNAAGTSPASRETLRVALAGVVGETRAAAFLRVLHDNAGPLTAAEILAYPRHRAKVRGWVKRGHLDLLKATLMAVLKHIQVKKNFQRVHDDRSAWKNLGSFLADLPGDLRRQAEVDFEEREYPLPVARKRR